MTTRVQLDLTTGITRAYVRHGRAYAIARLVSADGLVAPGDTVTMDEPEGYLVGDARVVWVDHEHGRICLSVEVDSLDEHPYQNFPEMQS